MKRILFMVGLVLFTLTSYAQKELTLEDAILKGRVLSPESKLDLKIIPGTQNYVYLSADYQELLSGGIKSRQAEQTIATVKDIKEQLPDAKVGHLYGVEWIDQSNFLISTSTGIISYNTANKKAKVLTTLPEGASKLDLNKTGALIYTVNNNIGLSQENNNVAITNFEDPNIVSGQAIARSEFGITKGTFWSPKNAAIAFYQKDETHVGNYPLLNIESTPGSLNSIKYPMAGQGSEIPKVGIYNLKTNSVVYLQSPIEEADHYFTNLGWSPDEKYVTVAEINRDQNHYWFNVYDAKNGAFVKTLFEEKNDRYVEPEHPAYFINNDEFVWLSERDGQTQAFLYNLKKGLVKKLSNNNWEITEIIGHSKSEIFVSGTGQNPTELHGFSIALKSGKIKQITKESGYHNLSYDENSGIFIDQYSSVTVPNKVQFINNKGQVLKTMLTAENPLADYNVKMPEMGTITSADGKTILHTRTIKPFDFDPKKKYPVLVYVYGGPHAQMVTNRWMAGAPLWMYTQANKGYIIFTVDNRGSAHRGFEFESIIHRNVGAAEMDDQLKGVEYLKSLPYVDKERMAVHGWSYGGYMTTSLMLRQPGTFKVGVAGGPVTDWSYYEVMYGERYMDRPEENEEGYKTTRLMNHVKGLEGDLLLIHGTVDDVVVMQHNLKLVKAFIDENIQVDFFPYPMHPHNVRGKDRLHLMTKVLTYIDDKLEVE